ncbi:Sister chromatid cohesion protein 2 [Rhizina undulata]
MNGSYNFYHAPEGPQIPPVDADDALQYTPLSSIVPFSPDMIPLPSMSSLDVTSVFQTEEERQTFRQTLDVLNREAQTDPQSALVKKYLNEISFHLQSSTGTQFRFKRVGGFGGAGNNKPSTASNGILEHGKVGKFGEMVMNKGNVHFRYPTTSTPVLAAPSKARNSPQYHPSPQFRPSPQIHPITIHTPQNHHPVPVINFPKASTPKNHHSVPVNNYQKASSPPQPYRPVPIASAPNGYHSSAYSQPTQDQQQQANSQFLSPTPPVGTQLAKAVIITSPAELDRSEYTKHTDIDKKLRKLKHIETSLTSKSRKRKRSQSDVEEEETLAAGVDQRAKADNLLGSLQSFINSIFEAEDNLSPDTSGRIADKNSKFWMTSTLDGDSPCLATAVQLKLEGSIHKVISARRFNEIPVDDLVRLQKLCESSLKLAEVTDLMPSEDFGEQAAEEWLGKAGIVDNALKTARTVLRIMLGAREEKQLYSEDLVANVVRVVKNLTDGAINPMIEMRSTGEKQALFKAATSQKKILQGLLHETTMVFSSLAHLLAAEEVVEGVFTSMQFMASAVVFLENAGAEKDSVFGIQKVERFRVAAMDIIAKIFERYPGQRTYVFDDILVSLEKLSINRQSGRQFKLVEGGKNIQLVSALVMRLVQISGTYQVRKKKRELVTGEGGEVIHDKEEKIHKTLDDMNDAETDPGGVVDRLYSMCNPLSESAQKDAGYFINFLVQRAMRATKNGDTPYRHLMDIFTEDFITVLGSPEWPAAQTLLRAILQSMFALIDGDKKQSSTGKPMAYDLLGLMGSGICDLLVHLRESNRFKEGETDSADGHITGLTERYLESLNGRGGGIEEELIDWDGPFRYALEHLLETNVQDASFQTACGYYLTAWSTRICAFFDKVRDKGDGDDDMIMDLARVASNLTRITLDKSWIDDDFDVEKISPAHVKQAYMLTVLHMPFCMSFEFILLRLFRAIEDNQATIRSKGLKAILLLLQKDPGILNRQGVANHILKRLNDPSPLVRDSALDFVGKCISLKPDLEDRVYQIIIERSSDSGVGVRKRAMKLLKDIYLRSKSLVVKVAIAEALVARIKDSDNTVSELARKSFEEIWITPFHGHVNEGEEQETEITPKMKLIVNERVSVIVKVSQREALQGVLLEVFKSLLHQETKNAPMNYKVCKAMVGSMCDDLLDRQGDSEKTERQHTLQTLTVFARANPRLFTPEQLVMLQPYIENLTSDDLQFFRSVIVIYRCALPILPSLQSGFLVNVQQSLLQNLSRLPQPELKEVVVCLWTINSVLKNIERLARVVISCLKIFVKYKGKKIEAEIDIRKLTRTLFIVGLFGKHVDFEDHAHFFKTEYPLWHWRDGSVSAFLLESIMPFYAPDVPVVVRKSALESSCFICQTHASHFLKPQVLQTFDSVFESKDKDMMNLVLQGIYGFLQSEEVRSEIADGHGEVGKEKNAEAGVGRLSQLANANQNDGVSTSLAQKYLKNIIDIALSGQDQYALTATEVIASILRQGLVHPKECVPALVALETSTNSFIQGISFREHRTLHSKHETIVERGYMDGVRSCFSYQRSVIGDGSGASGQPYAAKLRPLYDVVKASKKVRKKLLQNLTMSVDFDPTKLDLDASPNHLEYAKFIVENLAFFEYATLEDIYLVVTAVERVVSGTGMTVAHSIETEIFFIKIDQNPEEQSERVPDPQRLRTLASSAAILTMLWEVRTFLRKLYNLNENKSKDYKANKANPNLNRAPTRNPNVSVVTLLNELKDTAASLENDKGMMGQCRDFIEILSVDNEFKLAAEGEEEELDMGDGERERGTPGDSADEGAGVAPLTPKGRKRKLGESPEKGGKKKVKPKPRKGKEVE